MRYRVDLIALHITPVCAHRCPFCYAWSGDVARAHPPLDQLGRVVDAVADGGVREITLLGGDPASYPDVIPLARHINGRGIKTSILSNTLRFACGGIEEAARYIHAFEATIHHWDPEQHDAFCHCPGAYRQVVTQLRRAAELGAKVGVAVNILPVTAGGIFRLAQRLTEEGVPLDYIIVQRIVPFGKAATSSEFTLTRHAADVALQQIRAIDKELKIRIAVEDPFPLCVLAEDLRRYMARCEWGFSKAAVNAQGDLSRCGADPRYLLGNILETPLLDIWNNSPILQSFRGRQYLPGRCRVCPDLDRCGGGCALSCEFERDHGVDYLFSEYEKLDEQVHGKIEFGPARAEELSSLLQIEWSSFPGYGHIFSVDSLRQWFSHNPGIFWVVRDARDWVLGYAALVPITEEIFRRITAGEFSALTDFPANGVLRSGASDFYHVEALATVPSRTASRAGRCLVRSVGGFLASHARRVTASPITPVGTNLCKYFSLAHVADEVTPGGTYPIYAGEINQEEASQRARRF